MPDCKIKTIASEYGVNKSTIRFRLETNKLTAKDLKKPGWNVFSAETEAQLANLIAVVCNHGFSPTFWEIIDLNESYIKMNKLENSQFKNGSQTGPKWMQNFMKQNKLSLRKAEMISSA